MTTTTYTTEKDYVAAFHTEFKGLVDDNARYELVDWIISKSGASKWTNADKSSARESNQKLVEVLEKKRFINSWQTIQDFAKDLKNASNNEKPNLSSLSDDTQNWLNTNILSQNNQTVQNNSNNNSSHPTATPSQSTTNTTTTTSNTANNNTTNTTSTTSTTSNNATTNLSADQNVAITNLNSYKAKSELRDLHTHFQGMGTRDFWMSLVRNADSEGKSLRIEENALEDKDSEVKFHITSFGDLRKHVLNHQCTLKLLNHITQKDFTKKQYEEWTTEIQDALTAVQDKRWKEIFRTFTYDIVFSIYHLRTASLHPEGLKDESSVLVNIGLDESEVEWKPYVIWNARLQQFDYFEDGLKRKEIAAKLDHSPNTKKFFEEAFEFPGNPDKNNHSTKHQFNPQFYPRRYILRDALYEQKLIVLDMLLEHVLKRYEEAGVGYVEFSVGVGDLCRPWVFRHLGKENLSKYGEGDGKVDFRFLAMFSREKSTPQALLTKNKEPIRLQTVSEDDLKEALNHIPNVLEDSSVLKDLTPLLNKVIGNTNSRWIVGFDCAGNEKEYPFIPFVHPHFVEFIALLVKHFGSWGIRIHAAECYDNSESNHVAIIENAISKLMKIDPTGKKLKIRIGHGRLLFNAQKYFDKQVLEFIKNHVALEVCITSNRWLLKQLDVENNLLPVNQPEWTVVLGTDDDGIWSCDFDENGLKGISLYAEFLRAIVQKGVIDVRKFVDEAKKRSFSHDIRFSDLPLFVPSATAPSTKNTTTNNTNNTTTTTTNNNNHSGNGRHADESHGSQHQSGSVEKRAREDEHAQSGSNKKQRIESNNNNNSDDNSAEEDTISELELWLTSKFLPRGLLCDLFRWDDYTRSQIMLGNDHFILILKKKGIIDTSQSIRDFAKKVEDALQKRQFSDLKSLSNQLKATVAKLDKLEQ